MNSKRIQSSIHNLLKDYVRQKQQAELFVPGKTKVRYSGAFYGAEELISMTDAMLQGWFGLGERGELLEKEFTNYLKVGSTLLTNSGSSASLLCMAGLTSHLYADRVEPQTEVITPACTFATTVAAIVHHNLIPVFLDVDLETFNIDPEQIEAAITPKTRIIFLPHTLGNPNDMDKIMKIARSHKLFVVEDNCDALGSIYAGKMTGSFGILGTCSFYPAHHITLAGEGGAVFINDPRLHRVILSYRNWGRGCWCSSQEKNPDGACGNRFNFKIDGIPVDHKYYFTALGYNLKPVEIQAAMGLSQLKRFPVMEKRRKYNFEILFKFFTKYKKFFVLPRSLPKAEPCWFSFPLTILDKTPFDRKQITQFLESRLIETRTVFAGNIVRQPAMKRVHYRVVGNLDNSDKILRDTFFIGLGPHIGRPQLDYMQTVFEEYFKKF